MSVIKIDGFDAYQALGGSLTQASLAGTDYSLFSNGGVSPIRTTPGVSPGSMAILIARTAQFYANMVYGFSSRGDTVVIGVAFKGNTRTSILAINDALTVEWLGSGPMALNGVPGPNTIVLSRWYYLEVVIRKGAGKASLYINDTFYVEVPLPGQLYNVSNWAVAFGFRSSGVAGNVQFDDLAILDSVDSGDGVTSRWGPIENRTLNAETTPVMEFDNPTSVTPAQVANRVPPAEAVYLESDRSGAQVLFNHRNYENDQKLLALTVTGVLSKTDLDDRQMALVLADEAGEQERLFEVGLSYAYRSFTHTRDSQGAPWTVDAVNASNWGAVVRP